MAALPDSSRSAPTSYPVMDERNDDSLMGSLRELWAYRYLLSQWVARVVKSRYKNSAFGFLWSIVPPLLQVLVYTFLFSGVIGVKVPNYSAYLLCGIIPWTFFQTAILDSSQSLITDYNIIKKIYLPREIVPLAYVISNFIHFLIGWGVYFVFYCVVLRVFHQGGHPLGTPLLPTMLWFPVITLFTSLLVTGLSLAIAAVTVFYEDVKFVLQTLFQLLFFVLPILYTSDLLYYRLHSLWLYRLYMLNPVAAMLTAYRRAMLQPISPSAFDKNLLPGSSPAPFAPVEWFTYALAALLSVVIAWAGYAYFNRRKWQFVERV